MITDMSNDTDISGYDWFHQRCILADTTPGNSPLFAIGHLSLVAYNGVTILEADYRGKVNRHV